jgi:DNA-binding IclR family transcriptional regulator
MHDTDIDDNAAGGDKYIVPALERGLRLLGEFGRDSRTLTAPECARRLNLPRSTVFRLLNTLESMGFLERSESGTEYRLGMAVLRLGFDYLASLELTDLGQPILARLSAATQYPGNLVVRDGRSVVYVAKVASASPFASTVRVGTRLPAHATVFGRVLLQDMTLAELRKLYPEEHLESFSASTPATVLALFDLLQADQERGYVQGEGFFDSSISTLAAPVRDHTGHVVAALGATIPAPRFEAGHVDDLVVQVRSAADELSSLMNYRPQSDKTALVLPLRAR